MPLLKGPKKHQPQLAQANAGAAKDAWADEMGFSDEGSEKSDSDAGSDKEEEEKSGERRSVPRHATFSNPSWSVGTAPTHTPQAQE